MNWFEQLLGFSEGLHRENPDELREKLELKDGKLRSRVNESAYEVGRLDTPSLDSLREATRGQLNRGGKTTLEERVGDVQGLHTDAENAGAFFQVASQFNLLEMVGPTVTPEQGVTGYAHDHTQGPACAIACGAGTIFRNYFVRIDGQVGQTAERQIDCSRDLGVELGNDKGQLWAMRNGYLLPGREGLATVNERIESLSPEERDSLCGKLRIGVQEDTEVTIQKAGHLVTQAFCSAVPVAYSELPDSLWEPLARVVLDASYEATLHAALLNSVRTGNPAVYLTLLGGGAFGNRIEWIIEALEKALSNFREAGLSVYVVSYGSSNSTVAAAIERFNRG
ncbi:hypothetical protein VSU19_04765 [Verrucomicrobiales bacterium BCK34]|nr:hypothetical protein [Verrucomicrobiales bacterium BCK34]